MDKTDIAAIDIDMIDTYKPKYYKGKIFRGCREGMSFRYKLKAMWYDIQDFFLRGRNGYTHSDSGDIKHWFIEQMPHMLTDLRDNAWGWPGTEDIPTKEEWYDILTEMANHFTESLPWTCSEKNEYDDAIDSITFDKVDGKVVPSDPELWENFMAREDEIDEYCKNNKKKALKMFVKYFDYLWD